jgi:hypothetical protein
VLAKQSYFVRVIRRIDDSARESIYASTAHKIHFFHVNRSGAAAMTTTT